MISFTNDEKRYIYDLNKNLLNESTSLDLDIYSESIAFDKTSNKIYSLGRGDLNHIKLKSELFDFNGQIIDTKIKTAFSVSSRRLNNLIFLEERNKLLLYGQYLFDVNTLKWEGSLENTPYYVGPELTNNFLVYSYKKDFKSVVEIVNDKLEIVSRKTF